MGDERLSDADLLERSRKANQQAKNEDDYLKEQEYLRQKTIKEAEKRAEADVAEDMKHRTTSLEDSKNPGIDAWRNDPAPLEGQQMRWVATSDLDADILLPADLPVVEALKRQ